MSQHILLNRTEDEVLWFQRRSVIQAAAAWVGMGGFGAALAQQRSNIVELTGDAMVNGKKLLPAQSIQTGDTVETGPKSSLIFVVGNTSFQMRQNSRMAIERGASINAVSVLRLLTGGVASVWGRGRSRQITTPTLTAGIRGTGVYTEILKDQGDKSYFCNCYGVVDVSAAATRTTLTAQYHQAVIATPTGPGAFTLEPAKAINHTDEEQEFLARLVGQRTAWQVSGVKSNKDGKGGY
jgi:hypothetical protein